MKKGSVRIQITGVIGGSHPREKREAWKGLTLPTDPISFTRVNGERRPKQVTEDALFLVSRTEAIKALRKEGKEEAARYWERFNTTHFKFPQGICKIL